MTSSARRVERGAQAWVLATLLVVSAACSPDGQAASTMTTTSTQLTPGVRPSSSSAPTTAPSTAAPTNPAPTTVPAPDDPYSQTGWLAAENLLPGTADWRIVNDPGSPRYDTPLAWIEGYADRASAKHADTVTLFVDTPAESFRVRAFRMGWYGGAQARLIWESPPTPGGRQPAEWFERSTHMAEAPWKPSLAVDISADWPPGAYLLKLESSAGGAHYIPLTIRHDASAADLLFMSAVTTWQAYNPWGGCTLYECFPPMAVGRANVVSFDRPYAHSYGQGAADFPTHELPLISFIEELGIDTTYITNVDLHREPLLGSSRTALISTGHDEYYSSPMRAALVDALAAGTNIAFFGANAVYRNIRFEPNSAGMTERRIANYRRSSDPGANGDRDLVTVNWRDSPLRRPEAEIVGIQYGCAEVRADLRLVNTGSWIYSGTDAHDGQRLRNLVGVEFDELAPGSQTPAGLEVLAATPLACRDLTYQQVTAYHTRPSGAGVFAAGTINWNCGLDGSCPGIKRFDIVRGVTANVLLAFSAGPAGQTHPSRGNARSYRIPVHTPVHQPDPVDTTTTTEPSAPPPTDPPVTDPPVTDPPVAEPPVTP